MVVGDATKLTAVKQLATSIKAMFDNQHRKVEVQLHFKIGGYMTRVP
jgi:hypothetical protein